MKGHICKISKIKQPVKPQTILLVQNLDLNTVSPTEIFYQTLEKVRS